MMAIGWSGESAARLSARECTHGFQDCLNLVDSMLSRVMQFQGNARLLSLVRG